MSKKKLLYNISDFLADIQTTSTPVYQDESIVVNHQVMTWKKGDEQQVQKSNTVQVTNPDTRETEFLSPQELSRIYKEYLEYRKYKKAAEEYATVQDALNQLYATYKLIHKD